MSALTDLQTAVANLNTAVATELTAIATAITNAVTESGAVAATDAEAIVTQLNTATAGIVSETATLTGVPASQITATVKANAAARETGKLDMGGISGKLHAVSAGKTPARFVGKPLSMAKPRAVAADVQVLDDGTALITFTPLDPAGNPASLPVGTPPIVATASAPNLTLAVSPSDTSGFALLWIGTPTALGTGTVVTGSTTLPGASAPISASTVGIDVIADSATGLTVSVTAQAPAPPAPPAPQIKK